MQPCRMLRKVGNESLKKMTSIWQKETVEAKELNVLESANHSNMAEEEKEQLRLNVYAPFCGERERERVKKQLTSNPTIQQGRALTSINKDQNMYCWMKKHFPI